MCSATALLPSCKLLNVHAPAGAYTCSHTMRWAMRRHARWQQTSQFGGRMLHSTAPKAWMRLQSMCTE